MDKDNNCIDTTTNTFETMANMMSSHSLKKTIKNVFSLLVIVLVISLISLYFSLPVFQAKEMSLTGFVNFKKEEVIKMASLDGYHPNLFLNPSKAKENVLEESKGLILDCEFSTNGFVASGKIVEDYPVCKYADEVYFASGKLSEDIYQSLNELKLSEDDKYRLRLSYQNEMKENLPQLHFPKGTEASKENCKIASKRLQGVSLSSLSYIDGIQFINEQGDVNWDNVASAILLYKGEYYQLDKLRSELFSKYFAENFLTLALDQMYYFTHKSPDYPKTIFSYQDDDKVIETYYFYASYNDKKGSVLIHEKSEREAK